jgi:hypothetical protein
MLMDVPRLLGGRKNALASGALRDRASVSPLFCNFFTQGKS